MYNETYVRVLPRDARSLFSFWEIAGTPRTKARNNRRNVSAKRTEPVLRLYEVVSASEGIKKERAVQDIPIIKSNGSSYIDVCEPGRTYRVELGIKTHDGSFAPLCGSMPVTLPTAKVNGAPETPHRPHPGTAALIERSLCGDRGTFCIPGTADTATTYPLASSSPVRPFSPPGKTPQTDV